jgi:hypothetical protein
MRKAVPHLLLFLRRTPADSDHLHFLLSCFPHSTPFSSTNAQQPWLANVASVWNKTRMDSCDRGKQRLIVSAGIALVLLFGGCATVDPDAANDAAPTRPPHEGEAPLAPMNQTLVSLLNALVR